MTAAAALSGALAAQAADPLRIDTGSALTALVNKKTRVICNPRGDCSRDGARMENRAFDPGLVVAV